MVLRVLHRTAQHRQLAISSRVNCHTTIVYFVFTHVPTVVPHIQLTNILFSALTLFEKTKTRTAEVAVIDSFLPVDPCTSHWVLAPHKPKPKWHPPVHRTDNTDLKLHSRCPGCGRSENGCGRSENAHAVNQNTKDQGSAAVFVSLTLVAMSWVLVLFFR